MWTNSSPGISSKSSGSRSFLAFLLVFFSLSAYSLSAQTTEPTQPQTTPSKKLSEMTRDELIAQIKDKDLQLVDWTARGKQWLADKQKLQADSEQFQKQVTNLQMILQNREITIADLMTSLDDQKQASKEQLAARDKQLQDQSYALIATQKERDAYKDELQRRKGWDAVEKALIGLGGFGLGYTTGALIH